MVLDGKLKSQDTIPWVDTDISPWRRSDELFELTARDVWGFLKSHPNFNDVDLRSFYQSLVDRSYCSGFGPVITPADAETALVKVYLNLRNGLIVVAKTLFEFSIIKV